MAGLDTWDAGSVRLAGRDLSTLNDDQRALLRRKEVGFVFQAFHVLPHLDVAQNVAVPLMLLGERDDARVEKMLDAVGLHGLGPRLPQQLSGGQLQRVAIARALLARPQVLLADEPTGNLDAVSGEGIIRLFQRMAADGMTVLVVTHEERVSEAATRVLHLEEGRLR
jgi:putative ABC transport system ATP-binding protein